MSIINIFKNRLRFFHHAMKYERSWGHLGKHSKIIHPMRIIGKKFINIGNASVIMPGARIEAVFSYAGESFNPRIEIGDNVNIEQNVHMTCAGSVKIGNDVSILPDVLITDINHPYEDISVPPKSQRLEHKNVCIGAESIIGMGARILPGVEIGRHCCIGTNAVVTRNIPDYSVAVGCPAVVIKKYDPFIKRWIAINNTINMHGGG